MAVHLHRNDRHHIQRFIVGELSNLALLCKLQYNRRMEVPQIKVASSKEVYTDVLPI